MLDFIISILPSIPLLLIGIFLLLKPLAVAGFMGKLYWSLSQFTMKNKTEETRKLFFGERTLLFRLLGGIIVGFWIASIAARYRAI